MTTIHTHWVHTQEEGWEEGLHGSTLRRHMGLSTVSEGAGL